MSERTITYHQISCDHPGCTTITEPCPTPVDAWTAFWAAGGMLFLPGTQYRCHAHHHPCADGTFYPFPHADCPRCRQSAIPAEQLSERS